MKKLLIFIIFFFVFLNTAFTQIILRKNINAGVAYARGTINKDKNSPLETSMPKYDFGFSLSGNNAVNTFGFMGQVMVMEHDDNEYVYSGVRGHAWWLLMPEIKLSLGWVEHSMTADLMRSDLTAWGLTSNEILHLSSPQWAFNWYGGYPGHVLKSGTGLYRGVTMENTGFGGKLGGGITIYPLSWFGIYSPDKLILHLYFPTMYHEAGYDINDNSHSMTHDLKSIFYDRMEAQISYSFSGLGTAGLTLRNSMRIRGFYGDGGMPIQDYYDKSKGLYAQWNMYLPGGQQLEAGVNYTIEPAGTEFGKWPIDLGLGWRKGNPWNDDGIIYSSRLGLSIPAEPYQRLLLGWNFVYNRKMIPGLRLHIPVGFSLIFPSNKTAPLGANDLPAAGPGDKILFAWTFDPFIVKDLNGPQLYLCLRLFNGPTDPGWPVLGPSAPHNGAYYGGLHKVNKDQINWGLPVYIIWNF